MATGMVASEYAKWERRRSVETTFPRELVREILMQGYDRQTAIHCAIQLSESPPVKENAEIVVVRYMGKEIARLRPLRFFGMT